MQKTYKMCQSCGMPMKKDPQGGGTNADGTKSAMYCSFCYQQGAFTAPEIKTYQEKFIHIRDLTPVFRYATLKLVKTARPDSEQSEHGGLCIIL